MVYLNQRAGFAQHNPYTMDIDQENRNYYNCRGFGHMARNCRNRRIENRIGEKRRLKYGQRLMIKGNNEQNNLNEEEALVVLN